MIFFEEKLIHYLFIKILICFIIIFIYLGDIHLVRQNDEATKAFKTVLESGLNNSNYSKRFSLLLHFEEHQMELDIR